MDEATAFGFVGIKACPPLGYAMKLDTPKLGVLGGMGPLATVDFLAKLIAVTPAEFDQDHIPTIIYSAPYIPDRTANIRGHGPSPLPYMLSGLGFLEQSGVSCIAIPCNTAHFWYDQLSASASVPIFHIADAACDCVAPHTPAGSCIGILATAGTLMARVYQQRIETRGFRCLEPAQSDVDDLIMPAIHLIKAGDMGAASPLLEQARMRLAERGAERIIFGLHGNPDCFASRDSSRSTCRCDRSACVSMRWLVE